MDDRMSVLFVFVCAYVSFGLTRKNGFFFLLYNCPFHMATNGMER